MPQLPATSFFRLHNIVCLLLITIENVVHTAHYKLYWNAPPQYFPMPIVRSLAAGQPQPYVSAIPPLFRRGETPLYIPGPGPVIPDVDRFPSSEIHLPRRPSDLVDPTSRYRLKTRSHSARMTRCCDGIFLTLRKYFHVCLFI